MQPCWTLSWSSDAAYFTSKRPLRSSEEMLTHLAPLQKVEFPVTGCLKQAPLQHPKPAAPTLLPQAQLLPRISEILNQGGRAQQVILVVVAVRHGLVLQIREDRLLVSCCFGVAPEVAQPQPPPPSK